MERSSGHDSLGFGRVKISEGMNIARQKTVCVERCRMFRRVKGFHRPISLKKDFLAAASLHGAATPWMFRSPVPDFQAPAFRGSVVPAAGPLRGPGFR